MEKTNEKGERVGESAIKRETTQDIELKISHTKIERWRYKKKNRGIERESENGNEFKHY